MDEHEYHRRQAQSRKLASSAAWDANKDTDG